MNEREMDILEVEVELQLEKEIRDFEKEWLRGRDGKIETEVRDGTGRPAGDTAERKLY